MPYADPEKAKAHKREYHARPEVKARCAAQNKAWAEANREKKNASSRAYYARNRDAHNARVKDWGQRNPESLRASVSKYGKANRDILRARDRRRRALEREAFVEDVRELVLLEMDDGLCHVCGEDVDPLGFEVDHVIPLSWGGEHSYANTAVAHSSCNRRKWAHVGYTEGT